MSTQSGSQSSGATAVTKDFMVRILEDFKKEMFNSFRSEMAEFAKSVQFVSDKLDEAAKIWHDVREDLNKVTKANEELKAQNAALSGEVTTLKNKVRILEQYSRKNNIEISGVPVTKNENVGKLIADVGLALGVAVQQEEISAAHRVPTFKKDRPQPLIVQFLRRSDRDAWLSKFRDRKGTPLQASTINSAFPQGNIYVNEHLSPENKVFLAKVKRKSKELGYEHAWCRDGNFFVRKRQGERYIRINAEEDLAKL